MPRRIRDFALQSTQGGGQTDGYFDRVVKTVPADVIAAWTAAIAIINGAVGIPTVPVILACFVVGLGITFWWMLRQTKEANQPPAHKQAAIATVAFAAGCWRWATSMPRSRRSLPPGGTRPMPSCC